MSEFRVMRMVIICITWHCYSKVDYATGSLVPGWNVYVKPHFPQYWRSSWNDIYRVRVSTWCWQIRSKCTYEDSSSAGRALAAKTLDLAIRLNLIILQDGHLDLLALVLNFLRGLCRSHK